MANDAPVRFPRLPKLYMGDLGDRTPVERIEEIERFLERLLVGFGEYGTAVADYLNSLTSCGVYTPTLFNTTNIAASTAFECQWSRVGTMVTVSGRVAITPTAGAPTLSLLGISLPIPSNLATSQDCCGVGNTYTLAAPQGGGIIGDITNDRAEYRFAAVSNAAHSHAFIFEYEIL